MCALFFAGSGFFNKINSYSVEADTVKLRMKEAYETSQVLVFMLLNFFI